LARQVVDQVVDYLSSGFTVVDIVGVDGSPSCGVWQTLDIKQSLERVGRLSSKARAKDVNAIVQACLTPGEGIFIAQIVRAKKRREGNSSSSLTL
jgi:hypothetical protein